MTGDLLVIVPSRGRPGRFSEMARAALSLSEARTHIAVATDEDDPAAGQYQGSEYVTLWQGRRNTVAGWTNAIARAGHGNYRALASLSDDHMPRTQGWDRLLLGAIDQMGGTGLAYGNDLHQGEGLATSVVMSSDIVTALGWMALPACDHYHIDDAWVALGRAAGCLAYLPDVVIEHCHPAWGTGAWDEVYASEAGRGPADQAAFTAWLADGVAADAAVVASLRKAA